MAVDRGGAGSDRFSGELAQLGERLVCNQEVAGSSPVFSTRIAPAGRAAERGRSRSAPRIRRLDGRDGDTRRASLSRLFDN